MRSQPTAVKGRGSTSNDTGRYEQWSRIAVDDGWEQEPESAPGTTVQEDFSKTVIARNDSPDLPFDRSINMYRGCEHGCVYCYARPTHTYLGYSAGLDFETRLLMKPDVAEKLKHEIGRRSYQCRPIALGTNTDPYQPIERNYRLTAQLLDAFLEYRHPVMITTKSYAVVRDIDVLSELAELNLVRVGVSVTTLDSELSRLMEPRASAPHRRIEAIRRLSAARIPVTIMFSPVIPGLNDHEMEAVLGKSKEAGAQSASWIMLRLPLEVKDLFYDWLEQRYPLKASRVRSLIRQTRGGRDSDSQFHSRFRGTGSMAQLIEQRFRSAVRKYGLDRELPPLDTGLFRKPDQSGQQTMAF